VTTIQAPTTIPVVSLPPIVHLPGGSLEQLLATTLCGTTISGETLSATPATGTHLPFESGFTATLPEPLLHLTGSATPIPGLSDFALGTSPWPQMPGANGPNGMPYGGSQAITGPPDSVKTVQPGLNFHRRPVPEFDQWWQSVGSMQ
jgi:hypothetical protein